MNGPNALVFALIGAAMEALPMAFPGWFLPTSADGTSARALWLDAMGTVQVGLGALVGMRWLLASLEARIRHAAAAGREGAMALSASRVASARFSTLAF